MFVLNEEILSKHVGHQPPPSTRELKVLVIRDTTAASAIHQ